MALGALLLALALFVRCTEVEAETPASPAKVPTYVVGGSTAAQNLFVNLLSGVSGWTNGVGAPNEYQGVGSGTGISKYNDGTYAMGTGDFPQNGAEFQVANSVGKLYKTCHFPLALTVFGVFVKTSQDNQTDGGLQLSPSLLYDIYNLGGDWTSTMNSAATAKRGGMVAPFKGVPFLTGPIVRIYRNEAGGSGTTTVLKNLWTVANTVSKTDKRYANGFSAVYSCCADGGVWPAKMLKNTASPWKAAQGTADMCNTINTTPNSIGYAQSGVCDAQFGAANSEVALLSLAGDYVTMAKSQVTGVTGGNYEQAIPRQPPNICAVSWYSVGGAMILQKGAGTIPMVGLEYAFMRQSGGGGLPLVVTARKILTFVYAGAGIDPLKASTLAYYVVTQGSLMSIATKAKAALSLFR